MKKFLIILLFLVTLVFIYRKGTQKPPTDSKKNNDIENNLNNNLKPSKNKSKNTIEYLRSKSVSNATDRSGTSNFEIKKINKKSKKEKVTRLNFKNFSPKKLLINSIKTIHRYSTCLVKHNCQKNLASIDSTYNDPNNTEIHQKVSLSLDIYERLLSEKYDIVNKLTTKTLLNLIKIDNFDIRFTSINILLKENSTDIILNINSLARSFEGKSASEYIQLISSEKYNDLKYSQSRNILINYYLKNSTHSTLINLIKNMQNISFKRETIDHFEKVFCSRHFNKESESGRMLYSKFNLLINTIDRKLKCH